MASRRRRSPATKAKISEALTGKARSPATCAKIAASMRGRKHTDEAKAKMRAARAARPDLMTAARAATRSRHDDIAHTVHVQWRNDLLVAWRLRDMALFADIKQSQGWRRARKLFDPKRRVTDGYGPKRKRRLEDVRLERLLRGEG